MRNEAVLAVVKKERERVQTEVTRLDEEIAKLQAERDLHAADLKEFDKLLPREEKEEKAPRAPRTGRKGNKQAKIYGIIQAHPRIDAAGILEQLKLDNPDEK